MFSPRRLDFCSAYSKKSSLVNEIILYSSIGSIDAFSVLNFILLIKFRTLKASMTIKILVSFKTIRTGVDWSRLEMKLLYF